MIFRIIGFRDGIQSCDRSALDNVLDNVKEAAGKSSVLLISLNFPNLDYAKGEIIDALVTYALVAAIVAIPYTNWRQRTIRYSGDVKNNTG